jgi:hypothetical protein
MSGLDIARPRDIEATCPVCGLVLHLPLDWQVIALRAMDWPQASTWDGQLRCRNTLDCGTPDPSGTVMILAERWNCRYEDDGTVLVHLADDDNPRFAACDGSELWNTSAARPGTLARQCQACFYLAVRGDRLRHPRPVPGQP